MERPVQVSTVGDRHVVLGYQDGWAGSMSTDSIHRTQAEPEGPIRVRVHRTLRGRWEVVMPGRHKGIACETLEDARRVAYLAVAHARPCELIVHDAYHRVLERELIAGRQSWPTDQA